MRALKINILILLTNNPPLTKSNLNNSLLPEVVGSIPDQGTNKNEPINA